MMKHLKYIAFSLVLVASAGAVHASDSGRTSPGSGYTSGEETASLSSQSTEAATQFDVAANQLFSLSRDPGAARAALADRIKKVHGARTNREMEDRNIQQIYQPVDLLLQSIRTMQHVGVQAERIEELKRQLRIILDEILPDVSATDARGESDLSLLGSFRGNEYIRRANIDIREMLGNPTSLPRDASFSQWADATREFFSHPENQEKAHLFFTKLLHSGDTTGFSSPAKENSARIGREADSALRLFCYHLARAAGYDADDLIISLLREMKEAIQGSGSIVSAFNKILISDVRPLLLEVKLLENPAVLESYFQALLGLAIHTRDGIKDAEGRVIYSAYGPGDGIYTELQRVYSSLQIHVIRLRIETAILPALEAELGNKAALEEAQRQQAQLRAEQEEKRLNAMTPEKRRVARSEMLESSIREKMTTLRDIVENQVKEAEIAKEAEVRARFTPLLEEAEVLMVRSKADFDLQSIGAISNPAAVFDFYKEAKNAIETSFERAKEAIEMPIRNRLAEINALDARRAAKLAELRQVNAGGERIVGKDTLGKLDAMWGKTQKGVAAERNWRAEGTSKVSEAGEAAMIERAQAEGEALIIAKIKARKDLSAKMELTRATQINQLLSDTDFIRALENVAEARTQSIIDAIGTANFNLPTKRESIKNQAGYAKLLTVLGL